MSMRPDDHRRKWDKTEFQKKAQERLLSQTKGNEKSDEGNKQNFFLCLNQIIVKQIPN